MIDTLAVGFLGPARSSVWARQGGTPVAHVHSERNVGEVNKDDEVFGAGDCVQLMPTKLVSGNAASVCKELEASEGK
jgi:hypothetical protein